MMSMMGTVELGPGRGAGVGAKCVGETRGVGVFDGPSSAVGDGGGGGGGVGGGANGAGVGCRAGAVAPTEALATGELAIVAVLVGAAWAAGANVGGAAGEVVAVATVLLATRAEPG